MLHTLARLALGVVLVGAGISHFTDAESFLSQVPSWLPAADAVVAISGIIEVVLGVALVAAPRRFRPLLGWVVAAFFVAHSMLRFRKRFESLRAGMTFRAINS